VTENSPFEKQMLKFANTLQEKAEKDNTSLEDATNAFKALAQFFAILRKYQPEGAGDDDVTFDDLQQHVRNVVAEEAQNGGSAPAIRNRSGRA